MRCNWASTGLILPRSPNLGLLDGILSLNVRVCFMDDRSADLGLLVILHEQLGETVVGEAVDGGREGMVELHRLLLADRIGADRSAECCGVDVIVGRSHTDIVDVRAVLTDHANGDLMRAVAEDNGDEEVEDAKNDGQEARGQGQAP